MEYSSDRTVLSPVFNRNDKSFVYSINNFIEQELDIFESNSINSNVALKEKYLIYKQAFSKVNKSAENLGKTIK